MPAPWSKSAPKSDRRLEWKALKAKHAKTISPGSVEVGLGKALDKHQTQVTAILALNAGALSAEAFAPVVASSKAVKTLAVGLEPKVKNNDDYQAFLTDLKQDAAWWEKAAQDFKKTGGEVDHRRQQDFNEALQGIKGMQEGATKLDALLKGTEKKKGNYTPNVHVVKYLAASVKFKAMGAKLAVLNRNPAGNYKLIVKLLRDSAATIGAVRLEALYIGNLTRLDFPTGANLAQIKVETKAIDDAENEYNRAEGDM